MKCLALLDALASEAGPAGVSDLRRTSGARGTIYQRLQTLVAAGWVEAVNAYNALAGRRGLRLHRSTKLFVAGRRESQTPVRPLKALAAVDSCEP